MHCQVMRKKSKRGAEHLATIWDFVVFYNFLQEIFHSQNEMTGCYGPKYAECNNMTSGVYWAIHSAVSRHISDNRAVMTSWSSLTVTCAICFALSIVRQAIFEPSWHITWLLVYRGPLAMKTVIWPSSADRFLSPSPLPSPSSLYFSFISLGCGPAGTWREEWGKDGSSAQCKSLPPGKPASDARPHGPLTYCLPWFIAAFCLWPLQTLSLHRFPPGTTHTAPLSTGVSKEGFLAHAELQHRHAYIHCFLHCLMQK